MSEISSKRIDIDDIDMVLQHLKLKSHVSDIDIDKVIEFIETQPNTIFYFDKNFSSCEESDASYCWLDTGYVVPPKNSSDTAKPLLISLYKSDDTFCGHIVGAPNFLSVKIAEFNHISEHDRRAKVERFHAKYKKKIEERTVKRLQEPTNDSIIERNTEPKAIPTSSPARSAEKAAEYWRNKQVLDISNEINSLLLVHTWRTVQGLDRYIKIIGARLSTLVEQNRSEFYVLNNIQSAICNTGLLSKYGDDIHVLYRVNLTYGFYTPYKVIMDKRQYEEEGFTLEQSNQKLEPISFDDGEKFCVDISEINVNIRDLSHIIEERRSRFPEYLQALSDIALVNQIRTSLEIGLKLQKRDGFFAKPYYSTSSRSLSWALPFFLHGDINTEPELILVIHKSGKFYEVKTVLPYDDEIKDRLMNMSLYSRLW